MHNSSDIGSRKILSAVSHGSIFFNALVLSVGIPIAIYLISNDSVTKASAQEAINFHLNMWFWYAVFGVLAWVLIGLPFLAILAVVNVIMPIWAIIHSLSNPNSVFRYPLILRIL